MSGPTKLQVKLAQKFGKKTGIKPSDLLDVIEHESGFDPLATEHGGSVSNTPSEAQGGGLSQFITSTAKSYGVQYGASKHAQKTQIRGEANLLKDLGWGSGSPAEINKALAGYYGAASPYAGEVISSEAYAKYDKLKGGLKNLAGTSADTSSSKTKSKTKKVLTQPAVSNAGARAQAALSFIQDDNKTFSDYLSFADTQASLQDTPAQFKKVKTKGKKIDSADTAMQGAKSVTGKSSNIVKIAAKDLGTGEGSKSWAGSPSLPWCSLFVNHVLAKAGYKDLPVDAAYSGAWLDWGKGKSVSQKHMKPGDVVVFDWGDGGRTDHVAIYAGNGEVIGGNQSDSVTKVPLTTSAIVGVIRPKH